MINNQQFSNILDENDQLRLRNIHEEYRSKLWVSMCIKYGNVRADSALESYDERFGIEFEITKKLE